MKILKTLLKWLLRVIACLLVSVLGVHMLINADFRKMILIILGVSLGGGLILSILIWIGISYATGTASQMDDDN